MERLKHLIFKKVFIAAVSARGARMVFLACVLFFIGAVGALAETVTSNPVEVFVRPSVSCKATPSPAFVGDTVTWTATVSPPTLLDGQSYGYRWNSNGATLAPGGDAVSPSYVVTYGSVSSYSATVTVTPTGVTEQDLSQSATCSVEVRGKPDLVGQTPFVSGYVPINAADNVYYLGRGVNQVDVESGEIGGKLSGFVENRGIAEAPAIVNGSVVTHQYKIRRHSTKQVGAVTVLPVPQNTAIPAGANRSLQDLSLNQDSLLVANNRADFDFLVCADYPPLASGIGKISEWNNDGSGESNNCSAPLTVSFRPLTTVTVKSRHNGIVDGAPVSQLIGGVTITQISGSPTGLGGTTNTTATPTIGEYTRRVRAALNEVVLEAPATLPNGAVFSGWVNETDLDCDSTDLDARTCTISADHSSNTTVIVDYESFPDLTADTPTITGLVPAGSAVNTYYMGIGALHGKVNNIGNVNAPASFNTLYRSFLLGTINAFSIELGSFPLVSTTTPLAPRAPSGTEREVATLQEMTFNPGTFVFDICADHAPPLPRGTVIESNENNNCSLPLTAKIVSLTRLIVESRYNGTVDGASVSELIGGVTVTQTSGTPTAGVPPGFEGFGGTTNITATTSDGAIGQYIRRVRDKLVNVELVADAAPPAPYNTGGFTRWTGCDTTAKVNDADTVARKCIISYEHSGREKVTANYGPGPTVDLKINGSDDTLYFRKDSSALLSWTSENAESCEVSATPSSNSWTGFKPPQGSESTGTVVTEGLYQYTITCKNSVGEAVDSVYVSVSSAEISCSAVGSDSIKIKYTFRNVGEPNLWRGETLATILSGSIADSPGATSTVITGSYQDDDLSPGVSYDYTFTNPLLNNDNKRLGSINNCQVPPLKPDLAAISVSLDLEPTGNPNEYYESSAAPITGSIRNLSGTSSPGTFASEFRYWYQGTAEPPLTETAILSDTSAIPIGATSSLQFEKEVSVEDSGTVIMELCADRPLPGAVAENDETNNCLTRTISVVERLTPSVNLTITDDNNIDRLHGQGGVLANQRYGGTHTLKWTSSHIQQNTCTITEVSPDNAETVIRTLQSNAPLSNSVGIPTGGLSNAKHRFKITCDAVPNASSPTASDIVTVEVDGPALSCSSDKTAAVVGETVTWHATSSPPSPPSGSYTLAWVGSEIPFIPPSENPYQVRYEQTGEKNATAILRDAGGRTAAASCGAVTVSPLILPDLAAVSVSLDLEPTGNPNEYYENSAAPITGSIRNLSGTSSPGTFTSEFRYWYQGAAEPPLTETAILSDTSALPVGVTSTLQFEKEISVHFGTSTMELCADRPLPGAVAENDETNNCLTRTISVVKRPTPSVDLTITDDNGIDRLQGQGGTLSGQRYGVFHHLRWTSENVTDNTCTLTQELPTSLTLQTDAPSENTDGVDETGGLSSARYRYKIVCDSVSGASLPTASDTVTIEVNPPTLSCSPDKSPVLVGETVRWSATPVPSAPPTGSYSFLWNNLTPTYHLQGSTTLSSNPLTVFYDDADAKQAFVTLSEPGGRTASVTCTVTVTTLPDLTAAVPTSEFRIGPNPPTGLPPNTFFAGSTMFIRSTVANSGGSSAESFTVVFQYKPAASGDYRDLTPTPRWPSVGSLSAGASAPVQFSLRSSSDGAIRNTPGEYYIRACADYPLPGSVAESKETNNCSLPLSIAIVPVGDPPSLPDLIISKGPAVREAGTLLTGQSISFSATVKNQGPVAAQSGTFYNRFRVMREDGVTLVANAGAPSISSIPFGSGASTTLTSSPWTATTGTNPTETYRAEACADTHNLSSRDDRVEEISETNNCSLSEPFTVFERRPDLTANAPEIIGLTPTGVTDTYYEGVATLRGSINNVGTRATPNGTFMNQYSRRLAIDGQLWDTLGDKQLASLSFISAGENDRDVRPSDAHRFNPGNTEIRLCADTALPNGVVNESPPLSAEGEESNCASRIVHIVSRPNPSVDLAVTQDQEEKDVPPDVKLSGVKGGVLGSQHYGGTHALTWTSSFVRQNTCTITEVSPDNAETVIRTLQSNAPLSNSVGIPTGGLSNAKHRFKITCDAVPNASSLTASDIVTVEINSPLLSCNADKSTVFVGETVRWSATPVPSAPPSGSFSFLWSNLTETYHLKGSATLSSNPLNVFYDDTGEKEAFVTMTVPGQENVSAICITDSARTPPKTTVTVEPLPPPPLPDLAAISVSLDLEPTGNPNEYYESSATPITGSIRNLSGTSSPGTFASVFRYWYEGTAEPPLTETAILSDTSAIPVGATSSLQFEKEISVHFGTSTMELCADRPLPGAVAESDETNNCLTRTILVKQRPTPFVDLTITDDNNIVRLQGQGGTLANQRYGGTHTLRWTSNDVSSCTGTGFETNGATNNTAGIPTGGLSSVTYQYVITCTAVSGASPSFVSDTVTVEVNPPSLSCAADKSPVLVGETVRWSATSTPTAPPTGSFSLLWNNLTEIYHLQGSTTLSSNPLNVFYDNTGTKQVSVTLAEPGGRTVSATCEVIVNAFPDLTANAPTLLGLVEDNDQTTENTYYAGKMLMMQGTINNIGLKSAPDSFLNQYEMSLDEEKTWSAFATSMPLQDDGVLLPGDLLRKVEKYEWLGNVLSGAYFRLCVDSNNRVVEGNKEGTAEQNNCSSSIGPFTFVSPPSDGSGGGVNRQPPPSIESSPQRPDLTAGTPNAILITGTSTEQPNTFYARSTIKLTSVIENSGKAKAEDFAARFQYTKKDPSEATDDDYSSFGPDFPVENLPIGANTDIVYSPVSVTTEGIYYVRAYVDYPSVNFPSGKVDESNETNNDSQPVKITVINDITILSLPDLIISAGPSIVKSGIVQSGPFVVGDDLSFTATVKNNGNADAGAFVNAFRVLRGGTSVTAGTPSIAELLQGNSQNIDSSSWKAAEAGGYQIEVCADSGSNIDESDESKESNCNRSVFTVIEKTPVPKFEEF